MSEPWTIDELMCVVMSRHVEDGNVLLEGIGTFLPSSGYELARRLHAPDALVFTPVGTVFRHEALVPSLQGMEAQAVRSGRRRVTYGEMSLQYLPAYLIRDRPAWKEFARPAQVDGWGNTNNVAIGSYADPIVRLPGAVGIPDGTSLLRSVNLYVPRHTPRVLVEAVDFVSGLGWRQSRAEVGAKHGRPRTLLTDLCLIGFDADLGAVLRSLHPGVTVDQVRAATGFALEVGDVTYTEPPSEEELSLLREEIDPLGLRRLEFAGARDRRRLLRLALSGRPLPSVKDFVT